VSGLLDLDLTPMQVAQLAQRAENAFVGVPCGLMDQAISALGTAGHALLFDARALEVRQVPLELAPRELLVLDTVAPHQLVDGGYATRRAQCDQAAGILGVRCLREASDLSRLEGVLLQRARHVVTEIARVEQAVALLDAGAIEGLGELMTASHVSLRDDFEVTVPALDVAVDAALAAGALGARMTGGGFGGSIVALAHDGAQVATAVEQAFAERGWPEPRWFVATASQGAHRLS
jgi:galactokinase